MRTVAFFVLLTIADSLNLDLTGAKTLRNLVIITVILMVLDLVEFSKHLMKEYKDRCKKK